MHVRPEALAIARRNGCFEEMKGYREVQQEFLIRAAFSTRLDVEGIREGGDAFEELAAICSEAA